jgi:hypothetical protein
MNKKYDNNNIIISSRAYFLQGEDHAAGVSAWIFQLEIEGDTDRWGRLVSGREEKGAYRLGSGLPGRGLDLELGQIGAPWPFFLFFLFSCFLFLICFISFEFDLQIRSNQFINFSKIQHNNTEKKETNFHDKTNFQNILYVWPIGL